jgi:glycosyltransferase involved in cell wall biosynthesis
MTSLSIIIPSYNEAQNVPLICARLSEIMRDRSDVEAILVNNGSTDGSDLVFKKQFENLNPSQFQLVKVDVNQGYGYGILQGLKQARGQVLAWTHSDMQTDPADVLRAFDLYKSQTGPVLVKGKRRNRALLDQLFTTGMQWVVYFYIGSKLDDINAQPKMFSRVFFDDFIAQKAPFDFSLDLSLLHQAVTHGICVFEVPVDFSNRLYGEAKGGGSWKTKIKLIRRTFAYIVALRDELRKG